MSYPVCDAAKRGDLSAVRSLIEEQGRNANEKDGNRKTALIHAATYDHISVVEFLVEKGADMEAKDFEEGFTALMWAAMNGRFRAAEYLLERGADIETKDMFGCTALMNTVRQHNQLQMVEYLVQRGADMETTDHNGATPLMRAAVEGYFPPVKYLLESGANAQAKDNRGRSTLHQISSFKFDQGLEMVATLLKHGANLSAVDNAGKTASQAIADRFTSGDKAQMNQAIQKGQLIVAVKSGDVANLRRLVEYQRANINATNHNGASILAHAARRGDLSMFEYLVERGAKIISQNGQPEDQHTITAMLQRRQEWIDQAVLLVHRWHLPLIAVRTIHEYAVGFNWSAVSDGFNVCHHTHDAKLLSNRRREL